MSALKVMKQNPSSNKGGVFDPKPNSKEIIENKESSSFFIDWLGFASNFTTPDQLKKLEDKQNQRNKVDKQINVNSSGCNRFNNSFSNKSSLLRN